MEMTNQDAIRWLANLKNDIGNLYYERLWPYAQAIEEIMELLEEQEAVEKNKECHEDKIAVECLNAIQTVNKYIDEEEDECGCTYWKDKKGYAFKADTGYFFEGLDNFEAYLIKRLKKAVK